MTPTQQAGSPAAAPQAISSEMISAYGTMLTWLFLATVILVLSIAVPTAIAYSKSIPPWIILYVLLSGAMGGFVSSLSRLYGLDQLPALLLNPNFHLIKNRYLAMYALTPPLVGVVGATVIYLTFAGGLLQGDLFPTFGCSSSQGSCDTGISGLLDYGPKAVGDTAKALVWSFIAGFSERLFPGVINTLAQQAGGGSGVGKGVSSPAPSSSAPPAPIGPPPAEQ